MFKMRQKDYDYIERRSKQSGFRSVKEYCAYVLVWNVISEESDLPTDFNYLRDNGAFEEAVRKRDKNILLENIRAESIMQAEKDASGRGV